MSCLVGRSGCSRLLTSALLCQARDLFEGMLLYKKRALCTEACRGESMMEDGLCLCRLLRKRISLLSLSPGSFFNVSNVSVILEAT
jgi:hypothetical protein